MDYRITIEDVHKIYETGGSHPILVTCDDLEDWVCKYDRSINSLFNEYIASKFLTLWNIPTPTISWITVLTEHIPEYMQGRLHPVLFSKHCFGSKFIEHTKEVDEFFKFFRDNRNFLNKIGNKSDFLKIGLFDLWMSNEDRNHNNYNLLLKPEENKYYRFYAIDHVACFNSGNLHRQLYNLSEDESILTSEIAKILFPTSSGLSYAVDSIVEDFYICTTQCMNNLEIILSELPDTWGINSIEMRNNLDQIFQERWLRETEQVFRQYLQLGMR